MNDDYGDETELDYILDAGTREAMDFDAVWLNPPTRVVMACDYD